MIQLRHLRLVFLLPALAMDPQTDPCVCADAGGIWYCSPDLCCHRDGWGTPEYPGDGIVNIHDFLFLLSQWGRPCEGFTCRADIDRDGEVGIEDFLLVLESWGQSPADFIRCRELP